MPNWKYSKDPSSKSGKHVSPNVAKEIIDGTVLLPGRRECFCEATRHELISNCISCGRIVCQQEGSGPCFTCGKLVCTIKEKELLRKDKKSSKKLYEELMQSASNLSLKDVSSVFGNTASPQLRQAIEQKEKLLNFDRSAESRTRVIDDGRDFYNQSSNKWLSEKQRELVKQKEAETHEAKYGSRVGRKVKVDFFGREVVDLPKDDNIQADIDELLKDDISIFDHKSNEYAQIASDYKPVYADVGEEVSTRKKPTYFDKRQKLKIQDLDLQCMSDEGMCLNLQQPFATLLISGIEMHAGITKYVSFRGRLWIRADDRRPRNEEMACIDQYQSQSNSKFPTDFPAGCLLGCVELLDCLGQEEYRNEFPKGKCGSVYVLVCGNPKEMKFNIPMSGKRGLFKMDTRFHDAAKKTLHKLS